MTNQELLQWDYEEVEKEVVILNKFEPQIRQYIPRKPGRVAQQHTFAELHDTSKVIWTEIGQEDVPELDIAGYTQKYAYYLDATIGYKVHKDVIKMSRQEGNGDIITDTILAQERELIRQIESFIINGKIKKTVDYKGARNVYGLYSHPDVQTSTYTTVKFATDPGVYNTIKDMVTKAYKAGYSPPYILVADNTLYDYFLDIRTNNDSSYKDIIKRNLGVVDILLSKELPAATSHDGVLMLFKPASDCIELRVAQDIMLERSPYDPAKKYETGILSAQLALVIKKPKSIVIHTTVDLAS